MIADRGQVAGQITALARRLHALVEWAAAPDGPFPDDDRELGELLGRVGVMLIAGGPASGDGPPSSGQGTR